MMRDYHVTNHKGYLLYIDAQPVEGEKRWYAEGIVFSPDFPQRVEELHGMKSKTDFSSAKLAKEHAIALCKIWIDMRNKKPWPSKLK